MTPEWHCYCVQWALDQQAPWIRDRLGGWPRDWREAAALYRRFGVSSFPELVSQFLAEVPTRQAMRGDVVMVDRALGICRGELAEFMDSMQPMKRATRAWKAV
jgi:hypothetical protein